MPASGGLPLPRAVLLDLDGTLVDTVETRIAAWTAALGQSGFPTSRDRLAPLIGIDGRRLAHEIATMAGTPIDEARAEQVDRLSGEVYAQLNSAPRRLPGVSELVAVLDGRGIAWAIVTSSRAGQVAASVASLDLLTEARVVDASHVRHAKPAPDLLLLAAHQLAVDPARCWYVGDSTWDMLAAVAARMLPIGVTAGSAVDAAALEAAGAALVVPRLGELADLLSASVTVDAPVVAEEAEL